MLKLALFSHHENVAREPAGGGDTGGADQTFQSHPKQDQLRWPSSQPPADTGACPANPQVILDL